MRLVVTCLCGAAIYAAFLVALAHCQFFPHQDKAAHVLASFLLTFLLRWSLGLAPGAVAALAVSVGGVDEILQLFQPGRNADPLDFLADVSGALVGCAALWVSFRFCGTPGVRGVGVNGGSGM